MWTVARRPVWSPARNGQPQRKCMGDNRRSARSGGIAFWLVLRKRPTPEELERARRQFLVQSGRLVDGMLLDVCEVEAPANLSQTHAHLIMLLYNYRIGGVNYECSRTSLTCPADQCFPSAGRLSLARRVTSPATPRTALLWAEDWTGVRAGIPVLPPYEDPRPLDLRPPAPRPGLSHASHERNHVASQKRGMNASMTAASSA